MCCAMVGRNLFFIVMSVWYYFLTIYIEIRYIFYSIVIMPEFITYLLTFCIKING